MADYLDDEAKKLHRLYQHRSAYQDGYFAASAGKDRVIPSEMELALTTKNQWLAGYDYYIKEGLQKHVDFLKTKGKQ